MKNINSKDQVNEMELVRSKFEMSDKDFQNMLNNAPKVQLSDAKSEKIKPYTFSK